ncbi:tol-pal system YbgF family protein [Silvanigrella sp.]|jgi:hypothetical protein|uniref:tol-pal system YbgF family protein n=1 Tax=Silvanigrella sp. TaxID=2024976 RepID=UPI0037CC9F4A
MKKIFFIFLIFIHNLIYSEENYFIPILNDDTKLITRKEEFNIRNDQQIKKIFRDIFDLHFLTWKEEFKREINSNEKNYDEIDNYELQENNKIEEEKLNKSIEILKNIIKEKNSKLPYSEACFKLALFSYITKRTDAEKSREILDNGLKVLTNSEDNKRLYVRMNLFAGDLALKSEKYQSAKIYFNNIMKIKLESEEYREEIIRSYIGFGDAEFELFHFGEANISYKNALKFSKNFIGYSENKYALLIGEIKLRLIWSSYRNADYVLATEYAQDFSRERGRYHNLLPKIAIEDVIRVGALSLYERKDPNFYITLAQDKAAGDFAKKMIINSFYYYIAAGFSIDVEKYAAPIEKYYLSTRLFPDFVKARLVALNKLDNINKYNEIAYYGTAFIAKDSLWKSRYILTEMEEENRRSMIQNLSLQSGSYYYNLGISTKSRSHFLKSAEIYHARILENFEGDLRGVLFQSYAQSLMMAGDYNLAWDASEESLKHPLDQNNLKISWFQLVNISRMQSEDITSTDNIEFKKYEKAVDGFIAHFPSDPQARLSLFECGKRAELLNDYENARNRYEKILSSPPLYFKEQSQAEKDKVSLALANLYIKMGAKEKFISDAAGSLEKISSENKISDEINKVIIINNYKLALEHASNLKEKGELVNSAKFLELWSKNYKNNLNSSDGLLISIHEFAFLQNWDHVQTLTEYFIDTYPNNSKINEIFYWKARASDMSLQFSMAASLYDKSSFNDDVYPDLEKKIFALKRAFEIYSLIQLDENVPRIIEKIAILESKKNIDKNEVGLLELTAADKFLEQKKYTFAIKIYKNLSLKNNISAYIKERATIGILTSELYLSKNRNNSETNFDKYISNLLNKNKINNSSILALSNDAIIALNNFDNEKFEMDSNKNFSEINLKNILNMDISRNFMLKRLNYLSKYKNQESSISHTSTLLGKMSLIISDSYSQLYKYKDKKDIYLVKSNQLQSEAKKYLYRALSISKNSSNDNLLLSSLLSRYSKRNFNVSPQANIQDHQKSMFILEYLPSSMGLVSQVSDSGGIK